MAGAHLPYRTALRNGARFADPLRLPAGDVLLQPASDIRSARALRADRRLARDDAAALSQADERGPARRRRARGVSVSDASGHPDRKVVVARGPPEAAVGRPRRPNRETEARRGLPVGRDL